MMFSQFHDYSTGVPFQSAQDIPQPGSLDAEAGIFCSTFDQTGTRLITGGADKSESSTAKLMTILLMQTTDTSSSSIAAIKVYKEAT